MMKKVIARFTVGIFVLVAAWGCSSEPQEAKKSSQTSSLQEEAKRLAEESRKRREEKENAQQRLADARKEKEAEQRKAAADAYRKGLNQSSSSSQSASSSSAPVEVIMDEQDEKLFKRVLLQTISRNSGGAPVSMSYNKGVVTLFGTVATQADLDRVVNSLKAIRGVTKVDTSELAVDSQ